jgi:hypothetical protein
MTLKPPVLLMIMAGPTGLEPATSNVTGWRSNQLNYDPALDFGFWILDFGFEIRDPHPKSAIGSGGHEGTRTPNFLLVREAVYQLTYVPEIRFSTEYFRTRALRFSINIALLVIRANCNAI